MNAPHHNEEFEKTIAKRTMHPKGHCRRPFAHWEHMAEVEMVEMLLGNLRSGYTDPARLPGYINRKRLLAFLATCDQEVVAEVLTKYDRMAEGFAAVMADMLQRPHFRNTLEAAGMVKQ